jgi:hypothetical protein
MIRSVMVKGIEALTAECMLASSAAGVTDEVLASLDSSEKQQSWPSRAAYNLDRMIVHGLRRAEEMAEVVRTLEDLGIDPMMSRATASPPARSRKPGARPGGGGSGRTDQSDRKWKGARGMSLIIDCHGHYTTAPAAHNDWREAQKAAFKAGEAPPLYPSISDDEIRDTLEQNQLRLLRERGADMTIFSPRASAMAHHVGDEGVSKAWARANNDLIKRCVDLYPEIFAGVCMLPQSPKADLQGSIEELERCVTELGFIGCNLNPDPGGGHFTTRR